MREGRRQEGSVLKMAGVSECFNIGSVVACKTCYEKEIEGEVLAFDPQTKMLILSILSYDLRKQLLCYFLSAPSKAGDPLT